MRSRVAVDALASSTAQSFSATAGRSMRTALWGYARVTARMGEHVCLDSPPGEKHCIHCHEQGHHYDAHFGMFGLEPRIDPFGARLIAGPCETGI
jgi:hypothetical protein